MNKLIASAAYDITKRYARDRNYEADAADAYMKQSLEAKKDADCVLDSMKFSPHVRAQLDSQLVVPSYKIVGLHAVDSKPCKVSMTTSNDRDASVSAAD